MVFKSLFGKEIALFGMRIGLVVVSLMELVIFQTLLFNNCKAQHGWDLRSVEGFLYAKDKSKVLATKLYSSQPDKLISSLESARLIVLDSSSLGNLEQSGRGGVARYNSGDVLFGFATSFSQRIGLQAEAQALLHGIKLCISHSINHATIEIESRVLLDIIRGKSAISWTLDAIVREIQDSLRQGHFILNIFLEKQTLLLIYYLKRAVNINLVILLSSHIMYPKSSMVACFWIF
ncbi:hypothetical protein ACH5RR_018227 [Cinchona calisaya]|uniref:RNase H type-1 domain-containing protein n=1 Tax=Cinchona calisaya TaxID=153742 RepID=A0ABD2ZL89_9GENT